MKIAVLPVFNEADKLEQVLTGLAAYVDRFILIDDGSKDGSRQIIQNFLKDRENNDVLIAFPRNRGKAAALKKAFAQIMVDLGNSVVSPDDLVILTDADGQIPAEIIPQAQAELESQNLDLLVGQRDFTSYPWFKRLGNRILTANAAKFSGFAYRDSECGFRVLKVSALRTIFPYLKGIRYSLEQEISVVAPRLGLKVSNDFILKLKFYRSNTQIPDFLVNLWQGFWIYLHTLGPKT